MPHREFHVLIADDDPQIRKIFTAMLTGAGYTVTAVGSGAEAFQTLQQQRVDLLILDLSMPQPDGFELLKQLRARKADLKVLVVSGVIQGPLLKAAEMVGATATLNKVDAPRLLVSTVQSLLK